MKFLKWLFVLIGLAGLIGGGVMLAKNVIDINQLVAVASANRSSGFINPRNQVLITAALAAGGGLLLGWGIGLPTRTGRGIRKDYERSLEARGIDINMDGRTSAKQQAEPGTSTQL